MRQVHAVLGQIEAAVAGLFLVAMVGLIFAGGVARLMQHPLNWTTDVATCLFAWSCFLCADLAWRKDGLMSVELVTELLPPPARRALALVNYLLIAVFLAFLTASGAWLAHVSGTRTFQGLPSVSYSWVTASIAVGGALLLFTTLVKIADHLHRTQAGRTA